MANEVKFGLGKGKVFPHQKARSLLHPVRQLIQSPVRVVRQLALSGDETVLELGCGPGYFSVALAEASQHGQLIMFDLQPEMLEMAVERTGISRGIAAVAGNAIALPFAAGVFDLVFVSAVLGEVPDREACLEEVRRTLRPGGRLVVNEVRGDPDYINAAELDRLCGEAGLRLVQRRRGRLRWTCVAEFVPA